MNLVTNDTTWYDVIPTFSPTGYTLFIPGLLDDGAEFVFGTDMVLTSGDEKDYVVREDSMSDYPYTKIKDGGYIVISTEPIIEPEPSPEPEPEPEPDIETVRTQKMNMIDTKTNEIITSGTDVELSTGTFHFALTIEDQSNINSLFNAVLLGAEGYLYHADGEDCTYFGKADIVAIYTATQTHITYYTTYGNMMRKWARRCETIEELNTINYGVALPEDIASEMQTLLAQAQTEMQRIVANLQGQEKEQEQ